MAAVDKIKQLGQRFVQVCTGFRGGRHQFGQRQLTQPVQAVPFAVFGGARWQDTHLRGRLGVEQEQDAVEESQRVLGE